MTPITADTSLAQGFEPAIITTHGQLRSLIHAEQLIAYQTRIDTNPNPSELEQALGVYLEELEPQVRSAVIVLHQKGYSTFSSGFDEKDSRYQMIQGLFTLSEVIKEELKSRGVAIDECRLEQTEEEAKERIATTISFRPHQPDLQAIQTYWEEIVALLPDNYLLGN